MKIILLSPIDADAIEMLRRKHDVSAVPNPDAADASLLAGAQVFVFRSGLTVSADLMETAPGLRLLVRAGSGLDNVDIAHAKARGIRLVRIPGPSAQAVAELTFGLILTLLRKVALADRLIRHGRWPKRDLGGPLIAGKTLGIVGLGNIGTRVGELGAAWGMHSIGCLERFSADRAFELRRKGIELRKNCHAVLQDADVVTVHVPLNPTTHHLISHDALSQMKTGSFLINTSRGHVVDEGALERALMEGNLAGAALDVHEREGEGTVPSLARLDNVVLTPHIGGMASDSQRKIGRRLVEIVDAYGKGALEDEVTAPELVT